VLWLGGCNRQLLTDRAAIKNGHTGIHGRQSGPFYAVSSETTQAQVYRHFEQAEGGGSRASRK